MVKKPRMTGNKSLEKVKIKVKVKPIYERGELYLQIKKTKVGNFRLGKISGLKEIHLVF